MSTQVELYRTKKAWLSNTVTEDEFNTYVWSNYPLKIWDKIGYIYLTKQLYIPLKLKPLSVLAIEEREKTKVKPLSLIFVANFLRKRFHPHLQDLRNPYTLDKTSERMSIANLPFLRHELPFLKGVNLPLHIVPHVLKWVREMFPPVKPLRTEHPKLMINFVQANPQLAQLGVTQLSISEEDYNIFHNFFSFLRLLLRRKVGQSYLIEHILNFLFAMRF